MKKQLPLIALVSVFSIVLGLGWKLNADNQPPAPGKMIALTETQSLRLELALNKYKASMEVSNKLAADQQRIANEICESAKIPTVECRVDGDSSGKPTSVTRMLTPTSSVPSKK